MTVALAMIVKNGAATMAQAIDPFLGIVDEISIVLGGASCDNTSEIAEQYATRFSEFEGPFHFGNARQQSFDQTAADWIIAVDADDLWEGVDQLPSFIAEADEKKIDGIYTLYHLNDAEFFQPRVYRNGTGQWQGAVHEVYRTPSATRVMKTSALSVTQQKDDHRQGRSQQNIDIGEQALRDDPYDMRTVAHLIKDYVGQGNFSQAKHYCNKYLALRGEGVPGHYDTEYLSVLHSKAELELLDDDYADAASTALSMLQVRENAAAWAVFAEACQKMAYGGRGLSKLAVFAADQALFSGKPRTGQIHHAVLSGTIPCLIKAMALHDLGDDQAALQMADLGRLIDPTDERLITVQEQLAGKLNEAA